MRPSQIVESAMVKQAMGAAIGTGARWLGQGFMKHVVPFIGRRLFGSGAAKGLSHAAGQGYGLAGQAGAASAGFGNQILKGGLPAMRNAAKGLPLLGGLALGFGAMGAGGGSDTEQTAEAPPMQPLPTGFNAPQLSTVNPDPMRPRISTVETMNNALRYTADKSSGGSYA